MAHDSLRWRLPLLVAALLAVCVGIFAVISYSQMKGLLVQAAAARAQAAADQLGGLLGESVRQRLVQLLHVSEDPVLRRFVADQAGSSDADVRTHLEAVGAAAGQQIELWSPTGAALLAIGVPAGSAGAHEPGGQAPKAGVRAFRTINGTVMSEVVVPIVPGGAPPEAPAEPIGFLVVRRPAVLSPTPDILTRLVGGHALVRVGTPGGPWTDFTSEVPEPARSTNGGAAFQDRDGTWRIGGRARIASSPWIAAVDFPLEEISRPARRFLQSVAAAALLLIVVATVVGRILTARITQPLVALSDAAARIAAGDFRGRVQVGRRDEIGRLGEAFNTMSATVDEMHQRLEARVEERTKELEAFAYSVSHDLRAPLRHIAGFAGLLEQRASAALDDQGRRYLRTITEASARMGRLIDDLLAFSRVGRTAVEKRRVALAAMVDDARAEVEGPRGDGPIEWSIGRLPDVDADPALLRLALINLLSNAVKYSRTRRPPKIWIDATTTDGEVIVSVRDNGVGFDPQYAGKLFGVFQRLHGTDEFEGTGIGLANVRQVIQRHGGRTWAEGAVDQGATFFFSLPAATQLPS
ncbi:MAG TPA: ATP-binding protein [Vicinamibacterales bacterium]|nr:ATP-binding protein [Vicinamibacterales bacterium]